VRSVKRPAVSMDVRLLVGSLLRMPFSKSEEYAGWKPAPPDECDSTESPDTANQSRSAEPDAQADRQATTCDGRNSSP